MESNTNKIVMPPLPSIPIGVSWADICEEEDPPEKQDPEGTWQKVKKKRKKNIKYN